MAMTGAERQRRYRNKQRAARAVMATVECSCGCGEKIPLITSNGTPAIYKHGHNPVPEHSLIRKGDDTLSRLGVARRRELGIGVGAKHYNWRGGEWKVGGGYVRRTLTPELAAKWPTALRHGNGWSIQRSHAIWNTHQPDRIVRPGQHVHHLNRIRDDDRIENLEALDAAEHRILHFEER